MGGSIANEQAVSLWCANPIIGNDSKKYISGICEDSLKLFFRLCNMRIYVDGFVDDDLNGMTIYHKKIYKMEEIIGCNHILLLPSGKKEELPAGITACDQPIVINPAVCGCDVYIYGAGGMGKWLLKYLNEHKIAVHGFIDSDPGKQNTSIEGIRVYETEFLKSLDQKAAVIEAGKYYQEMDLLIRKMNRRIGRYFCTDFLLRSNAVWIDNNEVFDGAKRLDDFEDKNVYLCGRNADLVNQYFEIFKLLDFENVCMAKWAENMSEGGEACCIEDLLLEENVIIVFCCREIDDENLNKLYALGLKRGKDFCDIKCDIWEKISGRQMLDVNLAHTRDMSGAFPGIAVLGNNKEDDYKIAILGGSTSTSGYYRFKSWPEFLYENYEGEAVTIWNGAVESYTSAQELIKLIRDIIWLKPDLVIVYDGNNDVVRSDSYNIFEIPYMKTIMEYAGRRPDQPEENSQNHIFCGILPPVNCIEVWLKNIEYMHAVCEVNHIKFLSFMQPVFLSKPQLISKREVLLDKKLDLSLSGFRKEITQQSGQFRELAENICRSHKYIFDLSHVLDTEDVYMDHCHVYEAGNKIIAREIYRTIKKCEKRIGS